MYASLEAQAAAIADDIAYDAHDIDDGFRAGLFALVELRAAVPYVDGLMRRSTRSIPALSRRGRSMN